MRAPVAGKPVRRGLAAATSWLLPGGLLVLMPKCPVCLAAYVAVFTGAGISIPVASGIRAALIAACASSLLLLAFRLVRKLRISPPTPANPLRDPKRKILHFQP